MNADIKYIPLKAMNNEKIQGYITEQKLSIPPLDQIVDGFLALKDTQIVGLSGFWLNAFHPNREYCFVHVMPSKRGKGVGKALFQKLETVSRLKRFQITFDAYVTGYMSFLKSMDFSLARETWEYTVKREDLISSLSTAAQSEMVKTLSELSDKQFKQLVQQQLNDYRRNHLSVNPLKDISVREWEAVFCDECLPSDSFVFLEGGNITAYLISYVSGDNSVFVGYTGSVMSKTDSKEFFSYCADKLFCKYQHLELEIDSTDLDALLFSGCFEKNKMNPWVTCIKDI